MAQALHWTTAILVVVAFIYGPGGPEERVYGASLDFDRQLHESLGLCVIALSVVRVLWRLVDTQPEPEGLARWMVIASKAVQACLYLLLFGVPLTAIVGAWLTGHSLTLLAGIQIAPAIAESHALGASIAELHGWLGDVVLWLAAAHAAAGIYHHWVLKDSVLVTMLPAWLVKRAPD